MLRQLNMLQLVKKLTNLQDSRIRHNFGNENFLVQNSTFSWFIRMRNLCQESWQDLKLDSSFLLINEKAHAEIDNEKYAE